MYYRLQFQCCRGAFAQTQVENATKYKLTTLFEQEYIACQISEESYKKNTLKKNVTEGHLQENYNNCRNGKGQWTEKHRHEDCAAVIEIAIDIMVNQKKE